MKSSAYVFFRLSRSEVFLDNEGDHDFSDNDPLQCNPAKYMMQREKYFELVLRSNLILRSNLENNF